MKCCGRSGSINVPGPQIPVLNSAAATVMAQNQFKATADNWTIERRIGVCRACPYFQKDICNQCGCYVVAKVGVLHERCPLHRW